MEYPRELIEFTKNRDLSKSLSNYGRKNSKFGNKILMCTDFLPDECTIKERLYYIENNIHHQLICSECGKNPVLINLGTMLPRKCSVKCAAQDSERLKKIKQTSIENNGGIGFASKKIMNSIIESYCEKTNENSKNIVNIFQLPSVKEKVIKTLSERHSDELDGQKITSPIQIPSVKEKAINTLSERYFDELDGQKITSPIQIPSIKEKAIKTVKDKYGLQCTLQLSSTKYKGWLSNFKNVNNLNDYEISNLYNILNDKLALDKLLQQYSNVTVLSNILGIDRLALTRRLINYGLYDYKYTVETELLEYCQTFNIIGIKNSRSIIKPLELDIYLPDHNLAIEYNGLFWHSSNSVETENKKYHLNKTELCREQGIQLFHIFENEWLDQIKQKIWKSIIRNKLGQSERIYARKTKVAQVTSSERKQFLIDNHLQGDCMSSVNLGLYLDNELISLMTFSKSRFSKKYDWELLRFCNKIGYSVVGGASKLLKAFRKENNGSIVSYADKRRSAGNLYKQLGFELSHESGPNYFYYKDPMVLESRIQYQKHKLKDKLDVFDSTLTESENMYNNGYRKIYDCGNQVWKFE